MRYWLALLAASSLVGQTRDLTPLFAGRTGSALVWNLADKKMEAAWNESRARSATFRPGSVLKPFVLAAYIEAGQYRGQDKTRCKDGLLAGPEALAYSCNEYFDGLLGKMEAEDRDRGFARFGLVAPRSSTEAAAMTNIALLEAWRRLLARQREERLRPVFDGLEQAARYGTARLAGIASTQVAGKTGTMRGTAVFAGYAPAERPKYLVLVQLDTGTGGGDAAPYAAKIFEQLFATGAKKDPQAITLRLFWQNPPRQLNLAPGNYPAGTKIVADTTSLIAPGPLEVRHNGDAFQLTVQIGLENYVAAVLHGEAGGFRTAEARKAMAVAARTYAAHFRHRHSAEGFDFCDTTHCQDARFVAQLRGELLAAVEATDGELLWYDGKTAAAYYHADSGGWLESAEGAPYLPARADKWWKETTESQWSWTMSAPKLAEALGLSLISRTFQVTAREPSGRVRSLNAFGHPAEAASFRTAVGRVLGWEKLPSRMFEVKQDGANLTFRGKGRGHGIGLPQTSAERMAAAGKSYVEILGEYYPGTKVSMTAAGLRWQVIEGTRIKLWTTQPAKDRALLALAEKELPVLEAMTGFRASPVLRVYPSRDAFRDSTGMIAPIAGATRGRQVKLPPNPALGTLRHELLHAILETNTKQAHPEWFREGMVLVLLREQGPERDRTEKLLQQHGKAKLLEFWVRGLPADAAKAQP